MWLSKGRILSNSFKYMRFPRHMSTTTPPNLSSLLSQGENWEDFQKHMGKIDITEEPPKNILSLLNNIYNIYIQKDLEEPLCEQIDNYFMDNWQRIPASQMIDILEIAVEIPELKAYFWIWEANELIMKANLWNIELVELQRLCWALGKLERLSEELAEDIHLRTCREYLPLRYIFTGQPLKKPEILELKNIEKYSKYDYTNEETSFADQTYEVTRETMGKRLDRVKSFFNYKKE